MTARLERWRSLLAPHQSFLQLFVIFVVFRLLAALFLQPGGFLTAATPDQFFYYHLAGINSGGQSPFVDYWTEFPPIFPWLVVLATRISLLIPAWSNGIFWFNAILRWLILIFDAGSLILIYATGLKLRGEVHALRAAQAFAVLFVPLWVFLGWFDSVVLFFLMLALFGLTRHQPVVSGLGIGLGFGAKLFPLAVLPAAVRVFSRRQLLILISAIAGAILVIFGPFMLLSRDHTLAFFSTLQGRTSWETIWALLDGYQGWGIVSSLALRNDPATASQIVQGTTPSHLPWLVITGVFGIVGLFAWTRRIDWQDARRSTAFSALTFGMMLLYAKGYSPQWALYLTALSLIILGGWRGVMYAIVLDILTVLEWPVAFVMFDSAPGFLKAVIIARTVMTVIMCVEFALVVYADAVWTIPVRTWLPRFAGAGFALALLIGTIPAARTYHALRRAAEPMETILDRWANDSVSHQAALTTQPIVMQRLSALVPDQVTLQQMPNGLGTAWIDADEWLNDALVQQEPDFVWLIEERNQMEYWEINGELLVALGGRECWVSTEWYDTTRATAFAGAFPPIAHDAPINFDNRVQITGYGANQSELSQFGMQCLSLAVKTSDPAEPSLELAVNLTTDDGVSVAGKRVNLVEHLNELGFAGESGEVSLAFAFLGDQPSGLYGVEVGIYDNAIQQWLTFDGVDGQTERAFLGTFEIK